ncbi:hypothetical protein HPB50_004080 [Hyalomma asiaticum]|uniref:Uncharacterized protein n=1 Tax=Hyalomma asiaticum TaxID=266040 RepID=A0ACB7T329_HYAAI|nr:hypothetical protein HPB50_004080 [Hyalomma asiaticum]
MHNEAFLNYRVVGPRYLVIRNDRSLHVGLLVYIIFEGNSAALNEDRDDTTLDTACVHDPKVSVEVFYETYCPDSRNFVLEQLNSTYAELSNIMQLQLVPYGKASRRELPNKWYSFDCQHGDKECYGNLLQTCVIKHYPEPSQHLPLVVCMFSARNPNRAYESCAKKQGFDLEALQKCVSGKEGNDLQLRFAEWTESVNGKGRLDFVPWIRMNGASELYTLFAASYIEFVRNHATSTSRIRVDLSSSRHTQLQKDKMYDAFTNLKRTLCEEYKSMVDTLCTGDSPTTQPIEIPQACKAVLS